MSRLSFGLVLIVGILAGGLGVALLDRGPAPLSGTDVQGMISDAIAADKAAAPPPMDEMRLEALVDDYLMNNPTILDRMTAKLTATRKAAQRAEQAELIAANYSAIYDDAQNVVL